MTILNYIDPFWFLMALGVGLLYTYVTAPPPEIIFKYPTPHNNITYTDIAGVCYKYKVSPATCPQDKRKIKAMPLQVSPPPLEDAPAVPVLSWKDQLYSAFNLSP